jgi:hypothetical protein
MPAEITLGEQALIAASRRHQESLPPLTPEQLRAVRDLQTRLEECVNKGPRGTDNAVAILRTFGSAAANIPGVGTIAALVANGVATGVDVAGGLARGVSPEQLSRDVVSGAASTGISALPGVGLAQAAGLVQNHLLPDEAHGRVMDRLIAPAATALRASGVRLPTTPDVCAISASDFEAISPPPPMPPTPEPPAAPTRPTGARRARS